MTQVGFYFVAHFSASRHKHLFISSVQIDFWEALGFLWLQFASSVPIGERDATACITTSYCVSLPQLRMTFSLPLGSLDYAIERGLQKRCPETDIAPSTTRLPPSNSLVPKKKLSLLEGGTKRFKLPLSYASLSHYLECEKSLHLKLILYLYTYFRVKSSKILRKNTLSAYSLKSALKSSEKSLLYFKKMLFHIQEVYFQKRYTDSTILKLLRAHSARIYVCYEIHIAHIDAGLRPIKIELVYTL